MPAPPLMTTRNHPLSDRIINRATSSQELYLFPLAARRLPEQSSITDLGTTAQRRRQNHHGVLLLQGNTGTGANWFAPDLAEEFCFAPASLSMPRALHDHRPDAPRPRRCHSLPTVG